MALNSNDSTLGFGDCIANNIPSRAFRYATESKNVLSSAGAMYVGTGIKRKTIMLLDAPDWKSGTSYTLGYTVTHNNRNYSAKNKIEQSTASPDQDTTNWEDITVGYDSYVTAVLKMPNAHRSIIFESVHLGDGYGVDSSLKDQYGNVVYVDDDGYLIEDPSNTEGHVVTGIFPCWRINQTDDITLPVVLR